MNTVEDIKDGRRQKEISKKMRNMRFYLECEAQVGPKGPTDTLYC